MNGPMLPAKLAKVWEMLSLVRKRNWLEIILWSSKCIKLDLNWKQIPFLHNHPQHQRGRFPHMSNKKPVHRRVGYQELGFENSVCMCWCCDLVFLSHPVLPFLVSCLLVILLLLRLNNCMHNKIIVQSMIYCTWYRWNLSPDFHFSNIYMG